VQSFAPYSLCFLSKANPFRSLCISIELDPLFHQIIFVAILYNTVLLGLADYSHVVKCCYVVLEVLLAVVAGFCYLAVLLWLSLLS
jgi:hypothetical protein